MATSIKDLINGSNSYMSYVGYESYKDNNKEFLRSDLWEFVFTQPPRIVYYPGDEIFLKRLNQFNLGIDTSVNGFEKRMRGNYVIMQQTGQSTNGSIQLNFTDREDQSISYFVDDWKQKIADRDTKYSFRKEDLVANGKLVILNSSRIPVRSLMFYNLIIQDAGLDENGSAEDGADRNEVPLSMKFEHYERIFN